MGDGVVGDELQLRRVAQLQGTAQFPAQEPGGGFETLEDLGFPCLVQRADIDPGIAQITGGIYPGNGDHAGGRHPGILQAAELVTELPLNFFVDAANSIAGHEWASFHLKNGVGSAPGTGAEKNTRAGEAARPVR